MPLQLEIVSEHREIVGDDAVREFHEGGTIGRSFQNDWILPDPDRFISSKHAAIDCRGGIYYLVDLSSNGVFVNEDRMPLGRGNTQRLFNGDRLKLGEFEIAVSISEGESIVTPLEEEQTVLPEPIEQSVEEDRIQSGIKLLDEDELADDDLNDLLFSEEAAAETSVESLDFFDAAVDLVPGEGDAEPANQSVPSSAAFDEFLKGVGLALDDLGPDVDRDQVMRNAGVLFREFVEGITGLLMSRANLKTAFRLDQTMMLPRHNNPIKLSDNSSESVRQLLTGHDGQFLEPREAVREVCRDLLFHQDAFLDAMTAAFDEFADRFDPDELLGTFGQEKSKGKLSFLGGSKHWEMYCDIYPALTEKGGGRFPQLFAEEFVRSYEQQIGEFKRLYSTDRPYPPKYKASSSDEPAEESAAPDSLQDQAPADSTKGRPDRAAEPDGD